MIEFMLQGQNSPFMVSLTIMIMIACLEGVTTIEEVLRVTQK